MKVLQINAVYSFLSTGVIAKDISDMLESNNEQSKIATQRTSVVSDSVYIVGNKLNLKYQALHSRIFGKCCEMTLKIIERYTNERFMDS